ncbi:methyl-accepting chemotaxis protein [Arenibacterium sp. LLYu02]|uniref:methyl-accepting chemotaxis protein n=1 Tax=Arenibacterium sp. LLYu02 TaxID=3404132 RepID=UPI003B20F7B5
MHPERDELLELFHLTGRDNEHLKRIGKLAIPMLPAVLDKFYERAGKNPDMMAFFADQQMVDRAKSAQRVHWEACLSGEFADTYFDSAHRIGRIHPRIGLPFSFFLSSHSYATATLQQMLLRKYSRSGLFGGTKNLPEGLAAMARAFSLDSHLILEAHFEAEQEELSRAMDYMKDAVNCLSKRDLTRSIPDPKKSDFPERFNDLRVSYNTALDALVAAMRGIREACDSVENGTQEVSHSADELSHRTESQAATLEQTAAAVEEITASMRGVAEATQKTSQSVSSARSRAEQGSSIVREAVNKMTEISSSSSQIGKIIAVIDDISFQTNLLALNAGVEAARAGESGRGFAVVASEVRALAQRTAQSAHEIKQLIDVSTTHVKSGVELVGRAGTTLQEIVDNIQDASRLTDEVASSTEQQAIAFNEINLGISQLDGVTQQNAAMVEETTAALVDVRDNTGTLASLVAAFNLGGKKDLEQRPWAPVEDYDDERQAG